MPDNTFFEEQEEQSRVKSQIVAKYFWAWAKVMLPHLRWDTGRIVYLDLFAGPGKYADGTLSTPLLVLQTAIADPQMRARLFASFRDADAENVRSLAAAISELPGVESLAHRPTVQQTVVTDDLAELYEQFHLHPTLLFADPWGYKGLSLRLLNSVLKDWGCECILFFNYRRINMAIKNPLMRGMMDDLFGEARVDVLRTEVDGLDSETRELVVVERFMEALTEGPSKYILPFRFRVERGTRTSHHLFFLSKSVLGYSIMKDIMAKESTGAEQGVPKFEYNPATRNFPKLFEYNRPLDELGEMLLTFFAGKTLKMVEVYQQHQVGTPFVKSNYKAVLANLEALGKITAMPKADERRRSKGRPTFADDVVVTFPAR
jgi:three-Cys-motif partner protein